MKTWKHYHSLWKKWGDRAFVIANSLHKYPPHGKNPVSKKKYTSSKAFVSSLRAAERKQEHYRDMTKKVYKKQTGKSW